MRPAILSGFVLGLFVTCGDYSGAQEHGDRLREKEHLKLAEAHDLAHQIMTKAEDMEKELREGKRRLAEEMQQKRGERDVVEMVQDLRAEVAKLRAELIDLRTKLTSRDD